MFTSSARSGLLLCVAIVAISTGGQLPGGEKAEPQVTLAGVRPHYTAFPDLKPPTYEQKEIKTPDGAAKVVTVEKGAVPLPALPLVAADTPLLRKVQLEQVHEGLDYLKRGKELIRLGVWGVADFRRYADVTTDTYRLAAELEEKPANRVAWGEARVRQLKEIEGLIDQSVRTGSAAPQELHLVRFQRLRAEADLLKLKAEVEKPRGK